MWPGCSREDKHQTPFMTLQSREFGICCALEPRLWVSTFVLCHGFSTLVSLWAGRLSRRVEHPQLSWILRYDCCMLHSVLERFRDAAGSGV